MDSRIDGTLLRGSRLPRSFEIVKLCKFPKGSGEKLGADANPLEDIRAHQKGVAPFGTDACCNWNAYRLISRVPRVSILTVSRQVPGDLVLGPLIAEAFVVEVTDHLSTSRQDVATMQQPDLNPLDIAGLVPQFAPNLLECLLGIPATWISWH